MNGDIVTPVPINQYQFLVQIAMTKNVIAAIIRIIAIIKITAKPSITLFIFINFFLLSGRPEGNRTLN